MPSWPVRKCSTCGKLSTKAAYKGMNYQPKETGLYCWYMHRSFCRWWKFLSSEPNPGLHRVSSETRSVLQFHCSDKSEYDTSTQRSSVHFLVFIFLWFHLFFYCILCRFLARRVGRCFQNWTHAVRSCIDSEQLSSEARPAERVGPASSYLAADCRTVSWNRRGIRGRLLRARGGEHLPSISSCHVHGNFLFFEPTHLKLLVGVLILVFLAFQKGLVHEQKQEFHEAKVCYQNAISINPLHIKTLQHLVSIHPLRYLKSHARRVKGRPMV